MEAYILPLITLFPVIYRSIARNLPRLLFSPLIYLGALTLALLTLECGIFSSRLDWVLLTIPLTSERPFVTIGLSLDRLSGLIGSTVLTIGAVVSRFSYKYLEDDPHRLQFMRNLSWTMTSVLIMLLSQNLIVFFISWVMTSYFLHQLLTHFKQRGGAMKAAGQKFWISRIGDLFILSSSVLIFLTFKTWDFDLLFKTVSDETFVKNNELALHVAAILLILGAMAKSAQFPFHFWLPNTMETPTPVSAIMHAGIINGGGYLIIRMSPLLSAVPLSLILLTFVGGFTTFYAVLIMLTQTNIKKSLAYSTIAQMGFMMLQCGLGVFHLAALHIVGHAFYKAYVFLSSTTATDFGRLQRYFPMKKEENTIWAPFIAAVMSIGGVFCGAFLVGFSPSQKIGEAILLIILALALGQIILSSQSKLRGFVLALIFGVVYKGLGEGMELLLDHQVSLQTQFNFFEVTLYLLIIPFFIVLYFLQNHLELINRTTWGRRLYVKIYRGGFF